MQTRHLILFSRHSNIQVYNRAAILGSMDVFDQCINMESKLIQTIDLTLSSSDVTDILHFL